jgi:hypothetical protein
MLFRKLVFLLAQNADTTYKPVEYGGLYGN